MAAQSHPDDIGLVADWAIQQLGIRAGEIEDALFRLPPSPQRARIVAIVEAMRDEEVRARKRIGAIARRVG